MTWTLVTGASGFVGSRLVARLIEEGAHVKAFVRAGSSLKQLQGFPEDRFKLAYGDILVSHTVYRALHDCDRMYHVASNFKMWDKNPERILQPAVQGTRAVLTAAKQRKLRKVVVTSSVAALGVTKKKNEPMDEQAELGLDDPETYIRSKHEALLVAEEFAEQGLPVVTVLPTGIVGPGDWKPTPTGASIVQYLAMPPAIRVPVTEGGLNLVDVDDVVEGHILAMKKGKPGERYILGGDNITFREMFDTLSELTGLAPAGKAQGPGMVQMVGRLMELKARLWGGEPQLTYRLARDYAHAYAWVTSEKAEQQLGYTHRPTREALARSVGWYLEKGYVPDSAARRVRLELRPA